MTPITIDRAVVEQALDALEYHVAPPPAPTWRTTAAITALKAVLAQEQEPTKTTLSRGVNGVCSRSACECEREKLGDQCIWLRPTDAELERRTGLRFTKAGAAPKTNQ